MTALAVLLASVGVADLLPRWRHLGGLGVAITGSLVLGLGWHALWVVPVVTLVLVVWLDAASHASTAGTVLLAVTGVALVAASPILEVTDAPIGGWYRDLAVPGLAGVPLDRAALGLGVLLFLTTAANVVVRQALEATGPQVLATEKTLRGGRLLGPLERWLVFGFAVSGNLGAIAVVVAAKGILRFPEISQDSKDGMRAEYVLVGSFVSWSLALVLVPLF
ncbi:hypothetical protein [Aeromicrobium sp. Leaf350]|uniref:hypothetical protein n=1 Tax=Aeromicrobium sp. Leaf350 TaxID=2876565 RepID=UPI001E6094BD|nr:hypothetical protein [Aeromicrobium sp. Leaf350]